MTKIVVFTDIHFNVEDRGNGIDPVKNLTEGLAHAAKYNGDADHIVVTGDLTHKGDVASYELLKQTLDKQELPIVLMIGNHDNRENFQSVFEQSYRDEYGFVQHAMDCKEGKLLFLDSLDGPPYNYPLSHRGFMCQNRLNWLDAELGSADGKPCFLFMHHHPHDVGFRAMDTIKLVNGDEFYSVLEKHGNVKHISCGHVHRTISGNHRGISYSVFKSTVGQMPMVFDKMDFHMETTTEPPAYGVIEIGDYGVTVHTEDYGLTDLDLYN